MNAEIKKRTIMVPDRTFTGSNTADFPKNPVSVVAAPWEIADAPARQGVGAQQVALERGVERRGRR